MNCFEGESELYVSSNKELVLTTHRIRRTISSGSKTGVTSMSLGELSGCQMTSFDNKFVFFLSLVFFLAGAYLKFAGRPGQDQEGTIVCAVIGILLLIRYFTTRSQGLLFTSRGGVQIQFTSKAGLEACTALIDQIELARERYEEAIRLSPANEISSLSTPETHAKAA